MQEEYTQGILPCRFQVETFDHSCYQQGAEVIGRLSYPVSEACKVVSYVDRVVGWLTPTVACLAYPWLRQ
jgi:hypothetical protein